MTFVASSTMYVVLVERTMSPNGTGGEPPAEGVWFDIRRIPERIDHSRSSRWTSRRWNRSTWRRYRLPHG
jgi:hypothetical protein